MFLRKSGKGSPPSEAGYRFRGSRVIIFLLSFIFLWGTFSLTVYAHYCPKTFTYDEHGEPANEVLLTGSFTDWASEPPDAYEMEDDDNDGIWEVTVELDIGTYLYKFIVDGEWVQDPDNSDESPDGHGGYNSVVHVECPYPRFLITSYNVDDDQRRCEATLEMQPAGADLDGTTVTVTLDHEPAPGTWDVNGNAVTLDVGSLADGIHDVRVYGEDLDGRPVEPAILKAYINVSEDWHDATLYFTMTDRFLNGDSGNDAPLNDIPWQTNYQGGDFQGIIDKIEDGYFEDLGVNALWISWPGDNAENPGGGYYGNTTECGLQWGDPVDWIWVEFSAFHGYWPAKLYESEQRFGTMSELNELVDKAHERGIRVLLDLVINHVHEESPYFSGSPDYFFHYPMQICQETWWQFPITCWFTAFLPDLNFSQQGVIRDFLNMAVWWAKQTGCDGFRVDALKHVEFDFITSLRSRMEMEMEGTGVDFYLVGETFTGNPDDIVYFLGDDLVHGQFDFPLNLQILKAMAWQEIGMDAMHSSGREFYDLYGDDALMSTFIGNHDIARFISAAAGDLFCPAWDNMSHVSQGWLNPPNTPDEYWPYQKLQLALTYIMTLPGIPLIYYGDEFGLPGAGDPDNRRMMKFGGDLNSNQQQTLDYTKMIGKLRRDHPALRADSWPYTLHGEWSFLVYFRYHSDERIIVALNSSDQSRQQTVGLTGTGLDDGDVLTELIRGGTVTVQDNSITVSVPGRSASIYSKMYVSPTPTPTGTGTYNPDTRTPTRTVTPTPTGGPTDITIDVQTSQAYYETGDRFWLKVLIENGGPDIITDMYVMLDVYGEFFFHPSWTSEMEYEIRDLLANWSYEFKLLDFFWPETGGTADGIVFWAILSDHETLNGLCSDQTAFGWR